MGFVVLIVVAGFAYIFMRPQPKTEMSQLEQVKKDDVARVEGNGDELEKAKSLRRMAFQNPEKAKEFTRQLVADSSDEIRASAYETAGSFSGDEWDQLIDSGLRDDSQNVRIATLRGLNRQPTASRAELVEKFIRATKDETELSWAYLALMRAAPDDKSRADADSQLVKHLNKTTPQGDLLIELYKIWPDRKELIPFAEKIVAAGAETTEFMPSFRFLNGVAKDSLGTTLKSAKWPDSRFFLQTVVDFVRDSCPKNAKDLLKKVTTHPRVDPEIQTAVEAVEKSKGCVVSEASGD